MNTGSGDGVLGRAANALSAGVHGEHYGAGPGGRFSSASGIAILAEGDVKADKLTYNTPRTHYLRVGPCDFLPASNEAYVTGYSFPGAYMEHTVKALLWPGCSCPTARPSRSSRHTTGITPPAT